MNFVPFQVSATTALTASLQPPTDYRLRGYTRIDLGLQAALDLLQPVREPGRNQYVLLLTDGEPSQPDQSINQRAIIKEQIAQLNNTGVLVFPVVLCNPTAGCAGEFLREAFAQFGVREAASAPELLRVFSQLYAEMKPDRSLISGRGNGLAMTTRDAQGVRRIAFVTPSGGLLGLQRDNQPTLTINELNDPSVEINVLTAEALPGSLPGYLPGGKWNAELSDQSGFVVIQSDSYPELLNPPPSIANSQASVHYYPAGKPLLLLARAVGPGANEPLLYNGKTPMLPFGTAANGGILRQLRLSDRQGAIPSEIRLQLGEDKAALQLVRSFRLEARTDLPKVEVFSPLAQSAGESTGLLADGHLRVQAGFSAGADVLASAATVYISDESADTQGKGQLVYQAELACAERLCTDENFVPSDGRSYKITFVVQGQKAGLRFADWGETQLGLAPAIYLQGLPAQLDLAQMPPEGWPLAISAGTTEQIGTLAGTLTLRRTETGEVAEQVVLNFATDVPEIGAITTTLRVDGLASLRPGDYTGELTLVAKTPAGLPINVQMRPGPLLPVSYSVARPVARIESQLADFGELLFDTSPNFRLDQTTLLPVTFSGRPFKLTAELLQSSCPNLTLIAGDLQDQDGKSWLPLRLTSPGAVDPATCTGTIRLAGPNADHDLFPTELGWQMRVNAVEWSLVSGTLELGDLQDAGAKVATTVQVRFTGKTPFVLQLADLQASGQITGNGEQGAGQVTLTSAQLEMAPVEVTGAPNDAGLYEVPLTLIARQPIPHDPLRGSFYSGQLSLAVVGLPGANQGVAFNLRSPSLLQRYIAPYTVPVYLRLPWALCAWPLTFFMLLVLVARVRGRGIAEEEVDEATIANAMPSAFPLPSSPLAELGGEGAFTNSSPLSNVWGKGEWGGTWGSNGGRTNRRCCYEQSGRSVAGELVGTNRRIINGE